MLSYFGNCNTPWECLILFEAAKEGLIPTVINRLTEDERKNIASGAIFIWDERRCSIRRWTDGITWSNSRVIGDFLEYRELLPDAKGDERPSRLTVKAYGLCKRTICLAGSEDPEEPKLRLVAYCSKRDALAGTLPLPSADPNFTPIVRRLEAIHGVQASLRTNGFQSLSGMFRRNPSPTRDRRKSRRAQISCANYSTNSSVNPTEPFCASDQEAQTWAPGQPVRPKFLTQQSYGSQRRHSSNASLDLLGRVVDDFTQPQSPTSSSVLPAAPTPITTTAYGNDQPATTNLLKSRLGSISGDRRHPMLILPQPLSRSRLDRRNSEDLRLLDKLDSCVNAFF